MKTASLIDNLVHKEDRPAITVLLDSEAGKEIRIAFKKDQIMKEHKTGFPIVVEIFDGAINFGVNGEVLQLKKGDLITLDSNVPHDLKAMEDSIVRLSLNKLDTAQRVEKVVEGS